MIKKIGFMFVGIVLLITLSGCGNTTQIKEYDKEQEYNTLSELDSNSIKDSESDRIVKTDKTSVDNVLLDGKNIRKITKDAILEKCSDNRYTSDYSLLCDDLDNPFFYATGLEVEHDLTYKVDLNGDGIIEEVKIKENNVYVEDYICRPDVDYFGGWHECFITDLNKNDKNLEIILVGGAEIGAYYFFNYDGKSVKYLGEVWGAEMDGYGNVIELFHQVTGINHILEGYYKVTENGFEEQDIEYDKTKEHTAGKLIFSEKRDEIKQCIDYIGDQGEKFETYRANAEILEEGTIFYLLDVYDEIPFVKLQDGREGYVIDYYAIEDVMRYK